MSCPPFGTTLYTAYKQRIPSLAKLGTISTWYMPSQSSNLVWYWLSHVLLIFMGFSSFYNSTSLSPLSRLSSPASLPYLLTWIWSLHPAHLFILFPSHTEARWLRNKRVFQLDLKYYHSNHIDNCLDGTLCMCLPDLGRAICGSH
jgi:hypothetical protein